MCVPFVLCVASISQFENLWKVYMTLGYDGGTQREWSWYFFWDQNLLSPYPLTCVYTLCMPHLFWVASLCVTPCQFEHLRKVYWTLGLQLGVASLSSTGRNSSSSTVNSARGSGKHSYIHTFLDISHYFYILCYDLNISTFSLISVVGEP